MKTRSGMCVACFFKPSGKQASVYSMGSGVVIYVEEFSITYTENQFSKWLVKNKIPYSIEELEARSYTDRYIKLTE